jgi:hypothetical protein
MFWTEDINELFKAELIPTDYMTIDDKLNTLTRLIIFVCLILVFLLQDTKILLLMIILVLIIIVIWSYQNTSEADTASFTNEKHIEVINQKICTKPSKDNPFMNPSLLDLKYGATETSGACPVTDNMEKMDELFDTTMYKNADDIYNRSSSNRQFYTVPGSSIPNDQASFANWLYNRGKSCKESNETQCYNNLYTEMRR